MGTSTQMSQMVTFKIRINHFSTQDDHKALIDAFERSEQDGLVDVLDHMKGAGRFGTLYGVGDDIKYIIQLPQTKEAGTSDSSSIVEFPSVKSRPPRVPRITGPRCRSISYARRKRLQGNGAASMQTVDKKTQQIDIETYQNPWNLINPIISKQWYTLTET